MDSEEKHWQHWDDLPDEKEKKMLEDMAQFIVNKDLQLLAQILFESGEPFTRVFSTLGLGLFGPFLEFFNADTYMAFLRKEGNMRELIDRIDELDDNKRKKLESKKDKKENSVD
jgi:predicted house-cleaning noncanonical NTP pyrophosphatase (MazG superfamily)